MLPTVYKLSEDEEVVVVVTVGTDVNEEYSIGLIHVTLPGNTVVPEAVKVSKDPGIV
jgi:hypothetical protein